MSQPERMPDYIQVGPNIEPLEPTAHLMFEGGVLKQWFVARCTVNGITYTKGEWRPVPQC